MAELKIPQKTLQDNFNLQDFKDDFNALNSEIEENKTLTDSEISRLKEIANTWETFKASGGEISGNLLAIQLATKSPSNNYRWAEETHDTGYKIISSNTNPSTGDWREEFIMAYDGFAPKNNKVLGTSENPWNDIFINGVSKSHNGYTKLPNGLILQWGKTTISELFHKSSSYLVANLPTSFTSDVLTGNAICSYNLSAGNYDWISGVNCAVILNNLSQIGIEVRGIAEGMPNSAFEIKYMILGY